jgi:hypothetical protein
MDYNAGTKTVAWTSSYANWFQGYSVVTYTGVSGIRDVIADQTTASGTSLTLSATLTAGEMIVGGQCSASDWSSDGTDRADQWAGDYSTAEKVGSGGAETLVFSGSSARAAAGGIVLTPLAGFVGGRDSSAITIF